MSDWPNNAPPTLVVSPFTRECGMVAHNSLVSPTVASAVWPAANLAMFQPFSLARPTTFVKLFCINGAAVSGNIDMGIYDWAGTRLVSIGTTAQAGTSAAQTFDITDTLIGPGRFYLAVALDNGTGTLMRMSSAAFNISKEAGLVEMTTAFPLPAVATLAADNARSYIPMIAATTRSVV